MLLTLATAKRRTAPERLPVRDTFAMQLHRINGVD